jgi:hypothetical protein
MGDDTRLSSDALDHIVRALRKSKDGSDKRKNPRVAINNQANMTSGKPAQVCGVWVRDISQDGIGILHTKPLAVTSYFGICVPVGGQKDMTVVYEVKYYRPISDGLYSIGGQLKVVSRPKTSSSKSEPSESQSTRSVAGRA